MTKEVVDPARSRLMSAVRQEDTNPEMIVRRALHACGFRYRLHDRSLPGTPDIVFPRQNLAIFVHGCFWHRHPGCPAASTPKTRAEWWADKFRANIKRDRRKVAQVRALKWCVLLLWECEIKQGKFLERLRSSLINAGHPHAARLGVAL